MKHKIFLSLFSLLIIFSSCKKVEKDVNDYLPVVKTVSAVMQSNGTVRVTGEIIYEGVTELHYAGFCADTAGSPEMMDNQLLSGSLLADNTFSVEYSDLTLYKKYYFRSFASNEYGYTYGDIIYIDSILPFDATPPCTITQNTYTYNSQTQTLTNVTTESFNTGENYRVIGGNGSSTLKMEFYHPPVTGKYVTVVEPADLIGNNECVVYGLLAGIFSSYSYADEGDTLYVTKNGEDEYSMTYCNFHFTYTTGSFYSDGNLTSE